MPKRQEGNNYEYLHKHSPVYGDIEPADMVEYMLKHRECATWNMQLQMHKYIWGWEKRGV